jgi:hypothetical protein
MSDDDLGLGQLPTRDVDALRAARMAHELRGAFVGAHARHRRPRAVARIYGRVEPLLVAAVAVMYLGWAFEQVLSLHR